MVIGLKQNSGGELFFVTVMFEYESKDFLDTTFGEAQDADWKLPADEIGGEFIPGVCDGIIRRNVKAITAYRFYY